MMNLLIHNYLKSWSLLIALSLLFFHQGYAQNGPVTEKLRINPDAAMGGAVSQYIDQVEYITLENSPQSAFGEIDQLEVTDKYYIICDNATASVLIFDKQGGFHAKIEPQKINPQNVAGFWFDKQKKMIQIGYIFNQSHFQICFFDLDGKLVTQQKIRIDQHLGTEINLGDNFSGYYKYWPNFPHPKGDTIAYELMVWEQGKLIQKQLPYHMNAKYYEAKGGKQYRKDFSADAATADSIAYYSREYDYNIYRLTPHTFQTAYQFIFPLQLSLPPNFRDDTVFNGKRVKFTELNKKYIYKIGNFFKSGNNLFFAPCTDNSFSDLSYIYNTRSQKLVCINKIVSDARSYFLPVTDAEIGGMHFNNHGILYFDGDSFYASYSSPLFFHQMEATKDKHPQYPPSLIKFFSDKKNLRGNPVLVQIKFKPQL